MKILAFFNGLCIVAMVAALIWTGLALGNHTVFQARFAVLLVTQIACLSFMFVRKVFRKP